MLETRGVADPGDGALGLQPRLAKKKAEETLTCARWKGERRNTSVGFIALCCPVFGWSLCKYRVGFS